MHGVCVLGDGGQEDGDRDALRERLDEPTSMRTESPDADEHELDSVEPGGVGDCKRVLAVVEIGASLEVTPIEGCEIVSLRLGLETVSRDALELVGLDSLAAELPHELAHGLGEAGRRGDRSEVPLAAARDLACVRALGDRRERVSPGDGERRGAESETELAKSGEADVEQPGRCVGDEALQVRAQEDAADKNVDGREWIALTTCPNRCEKRLLDSGWRAKHKTKSLARGHACQIGHRRL